MILFQIILLTYLNALAQEPGYLQNETPPKQPSKKQRNTPILSAEFARARGLKADEIRGMHYNRVACSRKLFTPHGLSLEGDGDIKVTHMGSDLYELEVPSHLTFTLFGAVNPFRNSLADIDATASRNLLNLREWTEGQSLVLSKFVVVYYSDEKLEPETVEATSEVKVMDGNYPKMYLVRETIFAKNKFSYYMLCQ